MFVALRSSRTSCGCSKNASRSPPAAASQLNLCRRRVAKEHAVAVGDGLEPPFPAPLDEERRRPRLDLPPDVVNPRRALQDPARAEDGRQVVALIQPRDDGVQEVAEEIALPVAEQVEPAANAVEQLARLRRRGRAFQRLARRVELDLARLRQPPEPLSRALEGGEEAGVVGKLALEPLDERADVGGELGGHRTSSEQGCRARDDPSQPGRGGGSRSGGG